ncbi:MAG: PIG-L family deacetylase, partial [Defluviitaleaceae bacterium]|nr:PIG-L family deacetylase [Defluviitaleaceae bacterium]
MEIFIPDNTPQSAALSRTTDLCIAAHHDDIEIMAYGTIAQCYGNLNRHFSGIVISDGGGSPRSGIYADYTNEQMKAIRIDEQKMAASIGRYSCQIFLSHSSPDIKRANNEITEQIKAI